MEWKMKDELWGHSFRAADGATVSVARDVCKLMPDAWRPFDARPIALTEPVLNSLKGDAVTAMAAFTAHVQTQAESYLDRYWEGRSARREYLTELTRVKDLFADWRDAHQYNTVPGFPGIRWLVAEDTQDPRDYDDTSLWYPVLRFRCFGFEYQYTLVDPDADSESWAYKMDVEEAADLEPWYALPESAIFADAVSEAREHFRSMLRPILDGVAPDVEKALDAKGL